MTAGNRWPIVLALTTLVATGACSVHRPQPVDVPSHLPETYRNGPPRDMSPTPRNPAPTVSPWWLVFDDPGLNELMTEAFAGSTDLKLAYARFAQAQAFLERTGASQLPTLSAQAQGSQSRSPGFSGDSQGSGYRLSLGTAYEIDLWRKLQSRTEAAAMDALAGTEDVKTVYISLSARVAELYFTGVEQRAQLKLTRETIRSFSDTLDLVEHRYREGLVPPLDVYQARQNLAAAQARLPDVEAGLATTNHALSLLLGRYPDPTISGTLAEIPAAPAAFPAGLPSELLQQRPDVEAAFLRVKAADARVAAAIADRFPSLNLLGSVGYSRTPFNTGALTGTFWDIILSAAQPLFDAGARQGEVNRTKAAFRELLAVYHRAVLTAFREVEDSLVSNETTERRIEHLQARADAAEAALRLSLDRYGQGLTEYLQVLSAQAFSFDARSRLLAERRQLLVHRIGLARALGGSWMMPEMETRLSTNTFQGTDQ